LSRPAVDGRRIERPSRQFAARARCHLLAGCRSGSHVPAQESEPNVCLRRPICLRLRPAEGSQPRPCLPAGVLGHPSPGLPGVDRSGPRRQRVWLRIFYPAPLCVNYLTLEKFFGCRSGGPRNRSVNLLKRADTDHRDVRSGSEALSVSICFPNSTIKPTSSEAHSGLGPRRFCRGRANGIATLTIARLLQLMAGVEIRKMSRPNWSGSLRALPS